MRILARLPARQVQAEINEVGDKTHLTVATDRSGSPRTGRTINLLAPLVLSVSPPRTADRGRGDPSGGCKMVVKAAVSAVGEAVQMNRQLQALLSDHASWLKPGRWVPGNAWHTVWHHEDHLPPPTLAHAEGKLNLRMIPNLRGIDRAFASTANLVVRLRQGGHPNYLPIWPSHPQRASATTALRARPSGAVGRLAGHRNGMLALAPDDSEALRVWAQPVYDETYIDRRRALERFLPLPGFTVDANGRALRESWVEGDSLLHLPSTQQLSVISELLEGSVNLATSHEYLCEPSPDWGLFWGQVQELDLPRSLRAILGHQACEHVVGGSPEAVAHGDLGPNNVVFGARTDVIDLDTIEERFTWYDSVKLIVFSAKPVGFSDLLADRRVTEQLARLWDSLGIPGRAHLSLDEMAALFTVAHTYYVLRPDWRENSDQQRVTSTIRRLWLEMSQRLDRPADWAGR